MLKITPEQLAALSRQPLANYRSRLAAFVREQFADELRDSPPGAVEAAVTRTHEYAIGWRLDNDEAVRTLLVMRFTFGHDLAELSWVREVVDDPFGRKLDRLVAAARRLAP